MYCPWGSGLPVPRHPLSLASSWLGRAGGDEDKNNNWAEESMKNACASSQGGKGHSRVGSEASSHSSEKTHLLPLGASG